MPGNSSQEEVVRAVLAKLDMLIALLAAHLGHGRSQRERIKLLSEAGLPPREIARLLDTTSNTVRVTLVALRKGRTKRGPGGKGVK